VAPARAEPLAVRLRHLSAAGLWGACVLGLVVGVVVVAVVVGMVPAGAVVVTTPAGNVVVGAEVGDEVAEVPGARVSVPPTAPPPPRPRCFPLGMVRC
jgi:hypothetical protein